MPFPPFTSEHAQFRESVRAFAEREIAPNSEAWEREQSFPRDVFSKAGALGLLGVRFDPAYGGSGLDYWYTGILIEELMRGRNVGVVVSLMVQCEIATSIIHAYGSEELKHEWLVPAITGERIAALGVTEPGAGSNVAGLTASGTPSLTRTSPLMLRLSKHERGLFQPTARPMQGGFTHEWARAS